MKVNLIRNLESQRNKEQEDSFNETMNTALYFDINKTISKVDGWKISNIKKLVNSINKSDVNIDIEFTKWNESVEYIYSNIETNLVELKVDNEIIANSLRNRDFKAIHEHLNSISEDKNKKMEFLLELVSELKQNPEATMILNEFINKNISTLDVAIDVLLPLLFDRGNNE